MMNNILKIGIKILNLFFGILKLLPVQNKITYISRQMDSIPIDFKLVMDCIEEKEYPYKQVVLAKKIPNSLMGKIGYCFHIIVQMYHLATSKAVLLDTYCIPVSILKQREDTVIIQMWHALGAMKKFSYSILDQKEGRTSAQAEIMCMHKNYTYALASSEHAAKFFAEAFRMDIDKMRVYPLPRLDMLCDEKRKETISQKIYQEYPRLKDTKKEIIVYSPTFRKDEEDSLYNAVKTLIDEIDFDRYEFVLKKHPLIQFSINDDRIIEDDKFTSLEFFHVSDIIVTDYSAVLFEALALKKKVYFYAFDYEYYTKERSFYLDYKSDMPGPVVYNAADLVREIEKSDFNIQKAEIFYQKMVNKPKNSYTDDFVEFLINEIRK